MGKWVGGLYYPDAKDTLALTQAGASPDIIGAYNLAIAGGSALPSNLAGSEPMAGGGGAAGGGAGAGSTGVPVGLLKDLLPGYDWGGMGGNLGVVGIDVLDAILPYLTFDAQQALTRELEQMRQSGYAQSAQISASATLGAAQAQAGATTASAQIRSAADIKIAGMQAEAQLKAIREQIVGDLQRTLMGEQGAAMRLQAELQQAAQLANQVNRLKVAELAASSGLRDAIAARFFVRGLGEQPAIGSSFLAGPLQEIVAPNVGAPSMPRGMAEGTSGGAAVPTGGGQQMGPVQGAVMGGGNQMGNYASRVKQAWAARQGGAQGFAGGTPGSGGGILVGEAGPEVIRFGPRGVEVIPLVGKAQAGAYVGYDTTQPTTTRRAVAFPGQTLAESGWKPMVPGGAGGVFKSPPPVDTTQPGGYYNYSWTQDPETGQWSQVGPSQLEMATIGGAPFVLVPSPKGPYWSFAGTPGVTAGIGSPGIPSSYQGIPVGQPGTVTQAPGSGPGYQGYIEGYGMPGEVPPTVFTPEPEPPVTPPAIDPRTGLPIPEPVVPPTVGGPRGGIQSPGGYVAEPPPVVGGTPGGTAPPITDLSDLANIPAFLAARSGKAYPAWPNMTNPVELGAGMGTLPWPAQLAGVWQQLSPQDQEDLLAAFEFAGIPRAVALQMLLRGTPGYRGSPAKAFRVF